MSVVKVDTPPNYNMFRHQEVEYMYGGNKPEK